MRARTLPALLALLLSGLGAHAAETAWPDYQIIMWQGQSAAGFAALKRLGVTAGVVHGRGDAGERSEELAPLLGNGLGFYVENIATDFYSAYHRWSGAKPVNWRFLELKERFKRNRDDRTVFFRDPSLSDPAWQRRIDERLQRTVSDFKDDKPLYYNLADEPGIADLSAAWDFDFSAPALADFRRWLRKNYGSLAALEAEWGTHYAAWDEIMPMTTDEAIRGSGENFAPWADFKAFMDEAFAVALARGTAAVHAVDPTALAGIEGAQVPGTGGYDYTHLAHAVDVIEIYDDADNVEIARALNPKLVLLNTAAERGPAEVRYFWRELLRGSRGMVLWDAKRDYVDAGGTLGPRAAVMAPTFAELRAGLGALLINSQRQTDPIAILYSPASIRLQWLLERIPQGAAWSERDAGLESDPDPMRRSSGGYARLIQHMGLQHRFVSAADVAAGALGKDGTRVLILPMTVALSSGEAREIRAFAARGGLVVADGEPGRFDEHGRKLPQAALADLFAGGRAVMQKAGPELPRLFDAEGVHPPFALTTPAGTPAGNVEIYRFRAGATEIVGLLRDDPGTGSEPLMLHLPRAARLYDLRRHAALGETDRLAMDLAPYEPMILALAEQPFAAPTVAGPARIARGDSGSFALSAASAGDVLHVDVLDPDGNAVSRFSRNYPAAVGRIRITLEFGDRDPPGAWHIKVTDILSGESAGAEFTVTGG